MLHVERKDEMAKDVKNAENPVTVNEIVAQNRLRRFKEVDTSLEVKTKGRKTFCSRRRGLDWNNWTTA